MCLCSKQEKQASSKSQRCADSKILRPLCRKNPTLCPGLLIDAVVDQLRVCDPVSMGMNHWHSYHGHFVSSVFPLKLSINWAYKYIPGLLSVGPTSVFHVCLLCLFKIYYVNSGVLVLKRQFLSP